VIARRPRVVVINALGPQFHKGLEPSRYGRPGRIPGSVNVPAATLYDPTTRHSQIRTMRNVIARHWGGLSAVSTGAATSSFLGPATAPSSVPAVGSDVTDPVGCATAAAGSSCVSAAGSGVSGDGLDAFGSLRRLTAAVGRGSGRSVRLKRRWNISPGLAASFCSARFCGHLRILPDGVHHKPSGARTG
jgi:hypothetical protein